MTETATASGQANDGHHLPLFEGLAGFQRAWLSAECIAGATLAAVAIPEAMGYTKIAGMPVVTGIYTVALPTIAFAMFGSSRRLVIGADSATAAILFASLATMAAPLSTPYVELAGIVAIMAGGFLLLARMMRLGFLADFLSRTALVGFLTGIGLQVAISQLPEMLGVTAGGGTFNTLSGLTGSLGHASGPTLAVALAAVAGLAILETVAPKVPAALVIVVASIIVSGLIHLDRHGLAVVGAIQGGLPPVGIPDLTGATTGRLPALAAVAAAICIVVLAQSAATSRSFAEKHRESFNENHDLIGLAAANLVAGCSGTFVVNGSPTKTAVADAAGMRTQLGQLVASAGALAVLAVATGALQWLPKATLAAIVFVIGIRLVDIRHLRELWRLRRDEFGVAALTGLVVLFFGVEQGIALAVALSVTAFVRRAYRPRDVIMHRDPHAAGGLVSEPASPGVETAPGLIVYRFDSPLFFANAQHFHERVHDIVTSAPHPVRWLVIDLSPVSDVDYTAGKMCLDLVKELQAMSISIAIAHSAHLNETLSRDGVLALIGREHVFHGVRDAVSAIMESARIGGSGE